jgi:hypothetical protein
MFTSLMAADPLYETEASCAEFALCWLEGNRFLFVDVESDDKKVSAITTGCL